MNGFYQITSRLYAELKSAGFRVVTLGDYLKIDLQRQNPLPYCHIVPLTSTIPGNTTTFTFAIIGMDLVDFNKSDLRDEENPFHGTDNMQDVLNDIHNRLNTVAAKFQTGGEFTDLFRVNSEPLLDPFFHRYENLYAGWELTMTFELANNQVNPCEDPTTEGVFQLMIGEVAENVLGFSTVPSTVGAMTPNTMDGIAFEAVVAKEDGDKGDIKFDGGVQLPGVDSLDVLFPGLGLRLTYQWDGALYQSIVGTGLLFTKFSLNIGNTINMEIVKR